MDEDKVLDADMEDNIEEVTVPAVASSSRQPTGLRK
jgi:hypothetical protein